VDKRSIYFESLNRGKKSLAIDLKAKQGQQILHRLVEKVDVFIENFRPGVRDRLGCSDEVLKRINRRLVICSISGFGQQGRYAQDPSYDIVVQAMSGMMSINGPIGSNGMRVGFSIGDIAGGLFAAIGILARLYDRDRSAASHGNSVDVSMLSCQLALLENAYARFLNAGEMPAPIGSRHPSMAPFESYTTSDGTLVVGLGTNADWPRFCDAIEAAHLLADPRFATTPLRLKNRDALAAEINKRLVGQSREYWLQKLRRARIAAAPQVSIPEFATSDLAQEIRAFEKMEGDGRQLTFVRHPLSDTDLLGRAAPRLGEHTIEVLEDLGYTAAQLEVLRERRVINFPQR
jgi:crotonobetainyl-CoA:carnitine CoA-transferase CaiB-like acyl-CoA transferase